MIASQSIISGSYSMTQQAISLGFLPRMKVVHTEGREIGQIYIPFVNWALAAGTLAAVISSISLTMVRSKSCWITSETPTQMHASSTQSKRSAQSKRSTASR